MQTPAPTAAALLLLISPLLQAETSYRWVDENGGTVYSQSPPPQGEATIINHRYQRETSAGKPTGRARLNALRQQLEDRQEDRLLQKQTRQQADQQKTLKQQRCQSARHNLATLQSLGGRRLRTADGQYLRLTEEERQARIATAQQQINENCGR
jgi:Skp family chaperone for outer membrane proteins